MADESGILYIYLSALNFMKILLKKMMKQKVQMDD